MAGTATRIGIAVVEHQGAYLIGKRDGDRPLAGYAEFPGGKCQPDEPPDRCACRECLEETGLAIVAVELLLNHEYGYDHGRVDLHFWLCRPTDPTLMRPTHRGFSWVVRDELGTLDFPPANQPVIELLLGR